MRRFPYGCACWSQYRFGFRQNQQFHADCYFRARATREQCTQRRYLSYHCKKIEPGSEFYPGSDSTVLSGLNISASRPMLSLNELPPANHGRCDPPPFNIIMIEHQVHVNHGEHNKEPHHDVMPLADSKIPSHQRYDPGKHLGQPGMAHGSVHAKPRYALEQKSKK